MNIELLGFGRPVAKSTLCPGQWVNAWLNDAAVIAFIVQAKHADELWAVVLDYADSARARLDTTPSVIFLSSLPGPVALIQPAALLARPGAERDETIPLFLADKGDVLENGSLVLDADGRTALALKDRRDIHIFDLATGAQVEHLGPHILYRKWQLILRSHPSGRGDHVIPFGAGITRS